MELKELAVNYTKQETIQPLKGLARFIALGAAGSFLLGIGVLFWVLAMLRALQTETGPHFTGDLSWVPYALTLVASVVVAGIAAYAIKAEKRASERRKAKAAAARLEAQ